MKYRNIILVFLITIFAFSINVVAEENNVLDRKGILIKLIVSPYYNVDIEPKEIVITEEDFYLAKKIEDDKIVIEKFDDYRIKSSSNIPYRLWISAGTKGFTGLLGAIPIDSFQWRINKDSPWNSLSQDSYTFLESADIGVHYTDIDFRLVVNPYLIPPGLYKGDIIFTFESLE